MKEALNILADGKPAWIPRVRKLTGYGPKQLLAWAPEEGESTEPAKPGAPARRFVATLVLLKGMGLLTKDFVTAVDTVAASLDPEANVDLPEKLRALLD